MYINKLEEKSLNLTHHFPGSLRNTALNLADNQQALMMRLDMSPKGKKNPTTKADFTVLIYIATYAKPDLAAISATVSCCCLISYQIILFKRG